ncbi:MAG: MFS transporter [Eggerthellaceae bacterium]|nr:MFS transporter [Eggerthellaceae bacterium]
MATAKSPNYAWVVATGGFFAGIAAIAGPQIWGYVSPYIAEAFKIAPTDIAWGASLYQLTCGVFGFFVGMLGDRFGARKLVALGLIGMGICYILGGVTGGASPIGPCIFYGIAGLFAAFALVILLPKLISDWFAPQLRARGMLLNVLGGTATGALMGIILPVVILKSGWAVAFGGVGVVLIIAGIIWFLMVRDNPYDEGTIPLGYTPEEAERMRAPELTAEEKEAKKKEDRANVIKALKYPVTWIFALSMILWFWMFVGANVYQVGAIMEAGFSIKVAGGIGTAIMIANLVGLALWPTLSDKILSRKLFFGGLLLGAAVMYLIAFFYLKGGGNNTFVLFAIFVILGIFTITAPIQQTLYCEVYPPNLRNAGPGVLITIATIGAATAPIIGGWWTGLFGGSLVYIFLFTALSAVGAALVAIFGLPKTGGKYGDPLLEKYLEEEGK